MKILLNLKKIKSLVPCQSRLENYLDHYATFSGDLTKFLDLTEITAQDKVWVAVRVMPRFLVEVFAIDCAMRAQEKGAAAATYAVYAASYAADYATASYATANAADVYAASYATANAADVYAASYAADVASYAADVATATYAAAINERETQVQVLKYLIQTHKEPVNK